MPRAEALLAWIQSFKPTADPRSVAELADGHVVLAELDDTIQVVGGHVLIVVAWEAEQKPPSRRSSSPWMRGSTNVVPVGGATPIEPRSTRWTEQPRRLLLTACASC